MLNLPDCLRPESRTTYSGNLFHYTIDIGKKENCMIYSHMDLAVLSQYYLHGQVLEPVDSANT